jgi:flagellar biosynthesis/type III secretory pathway protein FliH
MLRRVVSRGLPRVGKAFTAPAVRTFSTLGEKERGEEARYFNAETQKQIADMKAKLEKIAESDNAELKDELVELLG